MAHFIGRVSLLSGTLRSRAALLLSAHPVAQFSLVSALFGVEHAKST